MISEKSVQLKLIKAIRNSPKGFQNVALDMGLAQGDSLITLLNETKMLTCYQVLQICVSIDMNPSELFKE